LLGQPVDNDAWQWLRGFYPGSTPGEQTRASTFEIARADFGEAWLEFSSKRTPADFQACAINPSLTGNNPQRDPFVCVAYKLENST